VLQIVSGPIQSLSVYDLDKTVTKLTSDFFPEGSVVKHLQISHSSLEEILDDCLTAIKPELESLSLVSGKLREIPQKAFAGLVKLDSAESGIERDRRLAEL
jgi:hypothetical protein